MIAWRIIKARYARTPLSTVGARDFGGRWNPEGVPVPYASASLSLAMLEVFVHLQAAHAAIEYVKVEIEIPDEGGLTTWGVADLPAGWRTLEGNAASQAQGQAWIESAPTLALSVPSVVVPEDRNILVTPFHAAFDRVRTRVIESISLDPRMWKEKGVRAEWHLLRRRSPRFVIPAEAGIQRLRLFAGV